MNERIFQTKILRIIYHVFNALLWSIGVAFVSLGTYADSTLQPILRFDRDASTHILAHIPPFVITFGSFVVLVSLIGWPLILLENFKARFVLSFLLGAVFTMQILAGIFGAWYLSAVTTNIINGFNASMINYRTGSASDIEINRFQFEYQCCGLSDYTEWFTTHWSRGEMTVPTSCCRDLHWCHNMPPLMTNNIWLRGCIKHLRSLTENKNPIALVVVVVVSVIEVFGFCICLTLGCLERQNLKKYEQAEEPIEMSVESIEKLSDETEDFSTSGYL